MIKRYHFVALILLSTLCGSYALAQADVPTSTESPTASDSKATLDQVLVTGEQAGPGLWKISKGDHVLWIFGAYAPLPKKMTWRSKEVEMIVAESQEVLTTVDVDVDIGFFSGLALLPSMIGLRTNPSGPLKDVLPPELYARWLVQKEKYIGKDSGIEKWRPIFAANELYSKALASADFEDPGMDPAEKAQKTVEKLAKKHKVKITQPTVKMKISKARAWVKEFKNSPVDDLACFAKTIERLETDMDQLRVRANAWAVGNVPALRAKAPIEQQDACVAAFYSMLALPGAQERGFDSIPAKVVDAWVAAAEAALANNASTFAVLSIDDIFWQDGYVAKLRAKGYVVDEP